MRFVCNVAKIGATGEPPTHQAEGGREHFYEEEKRKKS